MNTPLVSIVCTAYNHEKYITECLEGFVMQKTNFAFEVLINDDASTDRTAQIIQEYQNRYPQIIKPIYQTENQYSKKVGLWRNILFPRARGKYIAMCEGDDYWIDPLKLQKQVDFLETHDDYILVCGGYTAVWQSGKYQEEIINSVVPPTQENEFGLTFTLQDLNKAWFTKTLTALFRNADDLRNYSAKYKYSRDIHLFHYLLRSGKGYYMKQILGVYNMHPGGVSSLKSREGKLVTHYFIYKDMYEQTPDAYTRAEYLAVCQELLNHKLSGIIHDKRITTRHLLTTILKLMRKRSELRYSLQSLIPVQIKHLLMHKAELRTPK